jgi:outer membrane lipoprotein SlyB
MKITRQIFAVLAGAAIAGGAGCSSPSRLPVYDSSQVGSVIKSEGGEVISVRDVLIKAPSSPAGSTGMGSRIGAAAGRSAIFGGPAAAVGAAGAVIGEAVGSVAGAKADDRVGEEITILAEGGQTVTIVQDRSSPPLAPGERVRIITGASSGPYGGGGAKVVRDDGTAVATAAPDHPR